MSQGGRFRKSGASLAVRCALAVFCAAPGTLAADEGGESSELSILTHSYAQLFRSAATLGPGGSLMQSPTQFPVIQYVSLQGRNLDSLWGEDTIAAEVSGYSGMDLGSGASAVESPADLQTASVTVTLGDEETKGWIRLGRQVWAGGAARFARFDGGSARLMLARSLSFGLYGGLTVLPRWDQRPGYAHLGATADSLLAHPEAFEDPQRDQYSVVGGNVAVEAASTKVALSVHEQRENTGVARRNLGLDGAFGVLEPVDLGAAVLLDLDSLRMATGRLYLDWQMTDDLLASFEYLRAEPALLLSRQSVLSVFSTDGYQETGGEAHYQLTQQIGLEVGGFVQFYDGDQPGARLNLGARYASSARDSALVATCGYGRVEAHLGGYHSLRAALSKRLAPNLRGTLQSFGYLYDVPIRGLAESVAQAASLEYLFNTRFSLLWSGLLASSPYATFDASTQLRLTYALSSSGGAP